MPLNYHHHLLVLFILCAISLAQVLSFDPNYCDDILPKHAAKLSVVIEEYSYHVQDVDQMTPLESNSEHDTWQGCTDLLENEKPKYSRECHTPNPLVQTTIQTYIPAYPNFPWRDSVFTCVRILDRLEDGTGAYPVITAGGVGFDFVNYTVVGKINEGIKHIAVVYARGTDLGGGTCAGPAGLVIVFALIAVVVVNSSRWD